MPTYTTIEKTITCPCYNETVTLTGKYYLTSNPSNPYEAKFRYATCPIIENSHLPIYEQSEEIKYFRCTHQGEHCDFSSAFPDTISLNDI